jgi:hypothetical protein
VSSPVLGGGLTQSADDAQSVIKEKVKRPTRISDESDMDIRGVNRIKAFLGMGVESQRSKVAQSSEQRGSQQQKGDQPQKQFDLSHEQIEQAFSALLMSLEGSGLSAEKLLANGELFFIVKNPAGETLRRLGLIEIAELYFKRKMEPQPGNILKRSA